VVTDEDVEEARAAVMKELECAFRPEFVNRIDKVVVFSPLSKSHLEDIVALQLSELKERVSKDYMISLVVRPPVMKHLANKSWNPLFGARGVRRQIQDLVENPLAKSLLAEHYRPGDTVTVSLDKDGSISFVKAREKAAVAS